MIKKLCLLLLTASFCLSACGRLEAPPDRTPTPAPTGRPATPSLAEIVPSAPAPTATEPPLDISSSPEDIQQRILKSGSNWTTIWVDGIYTDLTMDGQDSAHEQLWIDQARGRFRFLSGPQAGAAQTLTVSDGSSKLNLDIASGARQVTALPANLAGHFVPPMSAGGAVPSPLGEQTSAWARNMIFSAYWAQDPPAGFKLLGLDAVAGRLALEVDEKALGTRIWVDALTGVILKQQWFGEGGGSMVGEYIMTNIQFDIPNLPEELFSLNPDNRPAFSDVMGNPRQPVSQPALPAGDTAEQYRVITVGNPLNGFFTDVYIQNISSQAEKLFISLDNVYREHYHVAEFHNGYLFIIRRIGDPNVDQNWSDQLWRYDGQGNEKMLLSEKGLDFRAAPDGSYAAVTYPAPDTYASILAIVNKNGEVVQEFNFDPSAGSTNYPKAWSQDDSQLWGVLQAEVTPKTVYQISLSDWSVKKFDVASLEIGIEFDLNPNTGQIVYSDYPFFFTADNKQRYEENATEVNLFLYDLNNQTLQVIATSVAKPFAPQWLDNDTIEYADPNGETRIDYKIK